MTVVFLILTFAGFVALDFLLNRKQPVQVSGAADEQATTPIAPFLQPAYVDGFAVPEELRYHQGHTWLYRERKNLSRVGVDEFAAAIAGNVDAVALPKPGQWIRQGQKAWTLSRNGETVSMISPIEGEVLEINEELVRDPSVLRSDPYGKGWLFTVHVPDEESTSRNLVPKSMVRPWMRESVERLYAMQPNLAGAAAADGGRPVHDVAAHLPGTSWKELANQFFLTV